MKHPINHIVVELDKSGKIQTIYVDNPENTQVSIIYHADHEWEKEFSEVKRMDQLSPYIADGYKFV